MYSSLYDVEFAGQRSEQYKQAIDSFTGVWDEDREIMFSYLAPQKGETILEIGAGSGFFSFDIANEIGNSGHIYITDLSADQLKPIIAKKKSNMTVIFQSAEETSIDSKVDKIWTRGVLHHVADKTKAFSRLYNAAKPGAKLVIFDIFSPSSTARFFDKFVAQACVTGHEVAFLSKEFADSLSILTGWGQPQYIDIPLRWQFRSIKDIGVFLSLLLASKKNYKAEDYLKAAEEILGFFKIKNTYYLNWPMTIMICNKV